MLNIFMMVEQKNDSIHLNRFKRVMTVAFPLLNVAVIVIVIYLLMLTGDFSLNELFAVSVNGFYIFLACLIILIMVIIDSFRWQISMHAMTKRSDYFLCMRTHLLLVHYNRLTPFSTGGHAYQLYYLHKHKFNAGEITGIATSQYVLGRIGFQLVTGIILLAFIWRLNELDGGVVVMSAIYGGIIFQLATTIAILFLCFSKSIPKKISLLALFLLHKMKIVKNHEQAKLNVENTLLTYRQSMSKLVRSPVLALSAIFLRMLTILLNFSIIIFIYASLFGWNWEVIPLLLLGIVLTDYLAGAMPIPGGTGPMELFFLSIFATLIGTPHIIVALVLWKIFSYVVPILNGVPVIIYESVKTFRNRKR